MILFPAIDLIAGKVVRLSQGKRERMDVYSNDPVAVAHSFARSGATWVHVVDLSSALGEDDEACAANAQAIAAICTVDGIQVDAGGGVRTEAAIERMLDAGVKRVAVGTALVRDQTFAEHVAKYYAEYAVADVAAQDGIVRINGWREGAGIKADELVANLAMMGFKHLVFTDVARDGMRLGIDAAAYAHIAKVAGFPVVASGGISSLKDITELAKLGPELIEGAITGRALYEGAFALEDALALAHA